MATADGTPNPISDVWQGLMPLAQANIWPDCSMKISQDIREQARGQNDVATGMAEMAQKFRDGGGEILVPVTPS